MGGIKKTQTSLEEHLRNAFLYLGVVVMIFSPQLMWTVIWERERTIFSLAVDVF